MVADFVVKALVVIVVHHLEVWLVVVEVCFIIVIVVAWPVVVEEPHCWVSFEVVEVAWWPGYLGMVFWLGFS